MSWKLAITGTILLIVSAAFLLPVEPTRTDSVAQSAGAQAFVERLVAAGGFIEPVSRTRELAATVVGRITSINVQEGEPVSAGMVIAEIENSDLQAQLRGAQATLMVRENELTRLTEGARPQEIEAARAESREAEAALEAAISISERRTALGEREIVSQEEVEQAHADRETAEARRDLRRQKLALLTAPPRGEDVAIAEANLRAAEARVAEIEAQIEKTLLRSPIDGVVLKLHRRSGESVTNLPPTIVASVGDTRHLRVRANFDEADVAHIALGQSVSVTADAYWGKRFQGTISQIGVQLGPRRNGTDNPLERLDTNVLEVLIDLEPGVRLPVGLPVDVSLEETDENHALSGTGPFAALDDAMPEFRWAADLRPTIAPPAHYAQRGSGRRAKNQLAMGAK